jgi:hypothetical protein
MSEPAAGHDRADGLGFSAVIAGLATAVLGFITFVNGLSLASDGYVDPSKIGSVVATATGTFVAGLVCATCTIVYAIRTQAARPPAVPAPEGRAVES